MNPKLVGREANNVIPYNILATETTVVTSSVVRQCSTNYRGVYNSLDLMIALSHEIDSKCLYL